MKTRSSVYKAIFHHDGTYQLRVVAVDRFGNLSAPRDINFKVALPKPKSLWETLASLWKAIAATATGFYVVAFIVLLFLTRWRAWAFRILSDELWTAPIELHAEKGRHASG